MIIDFEKSFANNNKKFDLDESSKFIADTFITLNSTSQAKILSKIILNYNYNNIIPEYEQIAELAKQMHKILTKEERIRIYEWMSCLRVNLENIPEEEE